jgi:hypothetical protein
VTAARLGTNLHTIVTARAQIRDGFRGIVGLEGGGSKSPTLLLGGGRARTMADGGMS